MKQTRLFVPNAQGEMRVISFIDQHSLLAHGRFEWQRLQKRGRFPDPKLMLRSQRSNLLTEW